MSTRRQFVRNLSVTAALVAVGCHKKEEGGDEDVTPAEDLMREHGVLRRVLFIYDEAGVRLAGAGDVPLDALGRAAALLRKFVEDYHEKMEETYIFPRFEQANRLADLTAVLRKQHDTGRALTAQITQLCGKTLAEADRAELATALKRFNHMYRAHAAREDTVLFPGIRGLLGAKAYDDLGEELEDKEHEILGKEGFEGAVAQVAELERAFGVDDLAKM